jgi:hypothetical protein
MWFVLEKKCQSFVIEGKRQKKPNVGRDGSSWRMLVFHWKRWLMSV